MAVTLAQHNQAAAQIDGIEIGELQTSIQPSLSSVSDDCLQGITAESGPFSSVAWYRMLERLDLHSITEGDVELNFAVVTSDGSPVAVCPLMRARGSSLFELYSFQRFYFESWIEQLRRTDPKLAGQQAPSLAFIAGYRRLLHALRCSLDDYLVVLNPLSFRSDVPAAAVSDNRRYEVFEHLVAALKQHAREQARPLWFSCVADEIDPLSQALGAADFQRVFFTHDTRIDLSGFDCFEDYLRSFSKSMRYNISREMKLTAQAGIRFRWADSIGPYADRIANLYKMTYTKYQDSNLRLSPEFWTALGESLPSNAKVLVAESGEEVVGFQVVISSDVHQETYGYKIGRRYDRKLEGIPFYFELSIYESVRRAIERGDRAYWVGPGLYDTKTARGACPVPFYSHFWFPQRRDRWMLRPYLERFGEAALCEQHKTFRGSFATGRASKLKVVPSHYQAEHFSDV